MRNSSAGIRDDDVAPIVRRRRNWVKFALCVPGLHSVAPLFTLATISENNAAG